MNLKITIEDEDSHTLFFAECNSTASVLAELDRFERHVLPTLTKEEEPVTNF